MRSVRFVAFLALAALAPAAAAEDRTAPGKNKTYQVPYKLTIPKHIVVRAKVNGKGPFNLILDTGAPALILATAAAKKAGVVANDRGWATLDRFELEGGLKMPKTPARIETPFQLEGMNGMGLAGLEIHGLMGYQALARYRMEIDFTKDKMVWTALDYKPTSPLGMGIKGGGGAGGLEVMGTLMKTVGQFLGRRHTPEVTLRGFHGMTLADGDEHPKVEAVLDKGPAGAAGLRSGDVVAKVNGRTVTNVADVLRVARNLPPGKPVKLQVHRGGEAREITVTTEEGI
ncbi:MAG: PDZ domain-containing protein [Gemmataceae bacterium]